MIENETLNKYLEEHSHSLSPLLDKVERETYLKVLQPHMLSGKNQAVFLKMMALSCNAKIIIELGTFTGYTALAFAEALGEKGKVISFEFDPEIAEIAKTNIASSQYQNNIEIIVGEAKELLADVVNTAIPDLVFIDADKEGNKFYYDTVMNVMKPGGIILVDNILWKGKVYDENVSDKKTVSIRAFNDYVRQDDRVDACILPMRDGIYFIRKR